MLTHVRIIAMALTVGMAANYPKLSHAVEPDNPVIGDWKFTRVLDSVDITSLDDAGAARLIGLVMAIRKDGARFDNYKCHTPDFETKRVEPNLYLEKEGGIDNSKLRLPNPVTVVDVSCSTVLLRNRNHAVITWRGYFFEASRVNRRRGS